MLRMKRLVKGLFFLVVMLLVVVLTFAATMRNIKVVDIDNGIVSLDVFGNVFDYGFIQ